MPKIKIISWNINGIRAVIKKGFTDFLQNYKPHILGLQEVKIDDTKRNIEKFDFQKYSEYWNSSKRPGYAGTMTLVREKTELVKTFINHQTGINHKIFDHEGRIQTLEFEKFYFVNVYFPNTRNDLSRLDFKEKFNELFLKHIKKLDKKKPVIAVADYNVAHTEIDLARPQANEQNAGFTIEERKWMSTFLKKDFVDTFREIHPKKIQYSWWTYRFGARSRNVGWRIDYVLVSKRLLPHVKKAFILDNVMGSDHCPVGIELDI